MRASTKRLLLSLWAGGAFLFCTYTIAMKISGKPLLSLAWWLGAVVVASSVVRFGRRFPTKTRQEWDLGWGRVVANGIMLVVGAFACLMLLASLLVDIDAELFAAINVLASATMGLLLGTILGCGGVLGIPEDSDLDSSKKT